MFAALSMIVASMAVFGLAHAKEDPINLFIQPGYFMAPETLAALKAKWGLDKPLVLQYLTWAGNMLRGDLGDSVQQQRPVTKIVGENGGQPHSSRSLPGYSERSLEYHLASSRH